MDGLEHIDPDERYTVVSLHEGFADALALLHLPLSLTFVARDELASFPLLGGHLARGRHLFIRPERPTLDCPDPPSGRPRRRRGRR